MSMSGSSQIGSDNEEKNPVNEKSRCTSNSSSLIRPSVDLFDINNPRLQYIFNKETDELSKSFAALKKTVGENAEG